MERSGERLEVAGKALQAFIEVMEVEELTSIVRDAAIQRFEFTFEAVWKAAKQILYDQEGIDVGSPKGVIRSCREVGIFDDSEARLALKMVDDRNLTLHTYNEELSILIYSRLGDYNVLLQKWIKNLKEKLKQRLP